ncbi:MAG: flavin reductase family protein [Clostridium sp.]|nr:flavin reductase family protein [Clostridium sp.]
MKENWKPGTMVYPLPAVLVSCGTSEESNLITIAWTGTICTNPPMLYISVRPERHSYSLIRRTMEFTVNLTTEAMARATDLVGVRSGRDCDKWALTGLTPEPGVAVACPSVAESPLSIECRVKEIVELGSHHMFIADVVNVRPDTSLIDPATGRFDLDRAGLIAYTHGRYNRLGDELGHFGWSVRKTPPEKKRTNNKKR